MRYLKHYVTTFFKDGFMVGVLGLALALSFISFRALHQYYQVDYSIEVPATVIDVGETVSTNSGGRTNRSYFLHYAYEYGGGFYESSRYRYSFDTPKAVLELKKGDRITALLNPADPSDAVIVNEISWFNFLGAGLGVVLLGVALAGHAALFPLDGNAASEDDLIRSMPADLRREVEMALQNASPARRLFDAASLVTARLDVDINTAKRVVRRIAAQGNDSP